MKVTVEHVLSDLHGKPDSVGETDGLKSPSICERKFLLLKDDDELVVVIGPPFGFVAEYRHQDLVRPVVMRRGRILHGPVGGGVAVVSGDEMLFEFWSHRITGHYSGMLEDDEAGPELERQLGMRISTNTASVDEPPF